MWLAFSGFGVGDTLLASLLARSSTRYITVLALANEPSHRPIRLHLPATFHHRNGYLSPRPDPFLRYLLVTPDVHRIHHSIRRNISNRKLGSSVLRWGHLFGSCLAQTQRKKQNSNAEMHKIQNRQVSQGLWASLTTIQRKEVT